MPYPVAKLAYGLRHRLSELATSNERYNLQIAAGNAAICPPERQPIKILTDSFCFSCKNGVTSVYTWKHFQQSHFYEATDLTAVHAIDSIILLTECNCQNLPYDILGKFLFPSATLRLKNCAISKPFIDAVSKIAFINDLYINGNQNSPSVISFSDIFNAFPTLESFHCEYCFLSKNWLSDILRFKSKELKSIRLYVKAEQFKTFEFTDLTTLLKNVRPGFSLHINIQSDSAPVKSFHEKLKTYMYEQWPHDYDRRVVHTTFEMYYNGTGYIRRLPPNDGFNI